MAHAVEGRFPFLDGDVVACAARMPESHKLHVLDEKHVAKRVAARLVPPEILARPKQPYRAPDAASFLGPGAPAYVAELLGEPMLARGGALRSRGGREARGQVPRGGGPAARQRRRHGVPRRALGAARLVRPLPRGAAARPAAAHADRGSRRRLIGGSGHVAARVP